MRSFDTVGALRDRVLGGDAADVVILSEAGIWPRWRRPARSPARQSTSAASRSPWQCAGAREPDVASPDALKQALLSADSIAHADPARGATAGAHFARVLERLGSRSSQARVTVLPSAAT